MTATIISTNPQHTFGQLTNRMVSNMINGNNNIRRLAEAIATASSGYEGDPGTQFEVLPNGNPNQMNLFGVIADEDHLGQKGQDYAYAVGRLNELWNTFWNDARQYIEQLDNGTTTM